MADIDGSATTKAAIGESDGVLRPLKNGQVVVRATATDGSGVYDELRVTISGQTLPYLSVNKPVTVSHTIDQAKERINDGDTMTRWNGGESNPWVYIDLLNQASIRLITLEWESAYAPDFRVQWSNDALNWQDIQVFTGQTLSNHAVSTVSQASLDALAQAAPDGVRYVRMYADTMITPRWGVSVYEFSIDGSYNITQPVTALTVAGAGGAEEITRPGRALQMVATALPEDATDQRVEWYVYDLFGNETAAAEVDSAGKLIPLADGLVQVVARSVDGGGVSGACQIEITGQTNSNLALGKPVTASGTSGESMAAFAVDGDYATRWGSGVASTGWFEVDLGRVEVVDFAAISWESAYAASFKLQTRADQADEWTTVYTGPGVSAGTQELSVEPTAARYVRVGEMTAATGWGFSIWELEVYGAKLGLEFDLNGWDSVAPGLVEPGAVAAQYGQAVGALPVLEAEGYEFLGWNTEPDGSGDAYTAGTVFEGLGVVVLYAQYQDEAPALALSATTGVKCIAGKAYLTVTAVNDSGEAASITVATPFGVKVFPSIAPGKSAFHSFTTRIASYSGVPVVVAGQAVGDPLLTGAAPETVAAASCS